MALIAAAGLAGVANAAPTITALSSFGTNGWLAPGANANLLTDNNQRGLAYNRATGNLILHSRTGGVNLRILDGQTGADEGGLQGTAAVTGGTFASNKVGVTDDGQIFVSNLVTDARSNAVKIYRWGSETDAGPTTWHNSTLTLPTGGTAPRLGDSFDVTGSGNNVKAVMGHNGTIGYTVFSGGSGGASAQSITSFSPTLAASKYRLGITFGKTDADVWGKVTSDSLYRSTYGAGSTATYNGITAPLTSAGESNMDFVTIGGRDYLAVLDALSVGGTAGGRVYIYDVTDPTTPVSLFAFGAWNTGNTLLSANGNASGSVAWGDINQSTQTATLYAMNSNQGIQAFTFTVPAPSAAALMGLAGLVATRRRR
jgi:hypothetical protein